MYLLIETDHGLAVTHYVYGHPLITREMRHFIHSLIANLQYYLFIFNFTAV